jgi:uncharacterized Fe-S cluster-containing radical SAM superfamily protein
MINPIKKAKEIEKIVTKNNQRKYYRFRRAIFYGGIATADCVGCNLSCIFCWAWNVVHNPKKFGQFYHPDEVSDKLVEIANKNHFKKLRISGNEPTISKSHLLKVLSQIPDKFLFILETNGILIGKDEDFAKQLSFFKNIHVRVSLKGTTKKEFSRLTLADEEFFEYQIKALENLQKYNVSFHPALIEIAVEDREGLLRTISKINPHLDLEIEPLILYPEIKQRIKKVYPYFG